MGALPKYNYVEGEKLQADLMATFGFTDNDIHPGIKQDSFHMQHVNPDAVLVEFTVVGVVPYDVASRFASHYSIYAGHPFNMGIEN